MRPAPALPRPRPAEPLWVGGLNWLRENLFATRYHAALTAAAAWVLYRAVAAALDWALHRARWEVVAVNLGLFLVGPYPRAELWRVWAALAAAAGLVGLSVLAAQGGTRRPGLPAAAVAGWVLVPPAVVALLWTPGGTTAWGGLLLTLILATVGIAASFPLGVLLALGRVSRLPAVRACAIAYIEAVRGVPLIAVLFFSQDLLPLFLPPGVRPDRVLSAMAGLVLFTAAYLAEAVRGGLQAVPRGQVEAAQALGLSGPLIILLVVLPQALRAVIPAVVGQFIALFKDTSLVSQFGLFELVGTAQSILAQPRYLGRHVEVYTFVALLYWAFSYGLSYVSRGLERRLGVGRR